MANIDRFWEATIEEATGKQTAPDLSQEIFAEISARATNQPIAETPKRKSGFVYFARTTAIAASLFLIAWISGVLDLNPGGDSSEVTQNYIASPDADVAQHEEYLELKRGWMLVTTGTPDVRCQSSSLTGVDGKVLLFVGSMPSREEFDSVSKWLTHNDLETEMTINPKKWVIGAALSALVLTGSALFDGNKIVAQEVEKKQQIQVWHNVKSVMEIEKLPKTATSVRLSGVQGAHLEFLINHKQIERLDIRNISGLRPAHLESLSSFPNLAYLNMKGANWNGHIDYRPLSKLKNLSGLTLDYPDLWEEGDDDSGTMRQARFESDFYRPLSELAARDVELSITHGARAEGKSLATLLSRVDSIKSLDLYRNNRLTDADFKAIAASESIIELNVSRVSGLSELGLAFLARANRLTSLTLDHESTPAVCYQIGKMTSLTSLDWDPSWRSVKDNQDLVASALSKLKALRSLKITADVLLFAFEKSDGFRLNYLEITSGWRDVSKDLQALSIAASISEHVNRNIDTGLLLKGPEGRWGVTKSGGKEIEIKPFKMLKKTERLKTLELGVELYSRSKDSPLNKDEDLELPGLAAILDSFPSLSKLIFNYSFHVDSFNAAVNRLAKARNISVVFNELD
ncbi:MAG: hypothetical protein V3V10_00610 [Planctomycetota bacterium]